MQSVRNKLFFILIIVGLTAQNFYSCGRDETTGINAYKKLTSRISQHNYFEALDLIDTYEDSLSEQQILWSQLMVYWDLFQIYDIGYYCALKLQQDNYNWYLENIAEANREILVTALYFLANNYYFDGATDKAHKTIQKGLQYIKNDHPLYDRFLIFSNPENNLGREHPDYYYYQYLNQMTPNVSVLRKTINKVKPDGGNIDYLRYIDAQILAVKEGLYREVLPDIRDEANFPGIYAQNLSEDNLIVGHIDLRVFLIRKELFKHLYIETVEALMQFQNSPDFDPYAYERAGWAELLKGDFQKSGDYFGKWLTFVEQNYSGMFLDYQRTHYQALVQLCTDLQNNQYCQNYSFPKTDVRNPVEVNGALTYNYFYYYMTKNSKSVDFFDEFKKHNSCFDYKIEKKNPVLETIYVDNISLLIKYFINNDISQSARLILKISDFTIGYDINSLEKLSYANIKAVEIFALLPYALKDEKYPMDLVASSYAAARNFPTSSLMTNLIAFKKAVMENIISGAHSLEQ